MILVKKIQTNHDFNFFLLLLLPWNRGIKKITCSTYLRYLLVLGVDGDPRSEVSDPGEDIRQTNGARGTPGGDTNQQTSLYQGAAGISLMTIHKKILVLPNNTKTNNKYI